MNLWIVEITLFIIGYYLASRIEHISLRLQNIDTKLSKMADDSLKHFEAEDSRQLLEAEDIRQLAGSLVDRLAETGEHLEYATDGQFKTLKNEIYSLYGAVAERLDKLSANKPDENIGTKPSQLPTE